MPARRDRLDQLARAVVLLAAWLCSSGCFQERVRPWPAEPQNPAQLSVEVVEPPQGATVLAGRNLTIRIAARDLQGSNLAGIGFVIRRGGTDPSVTLDSTAERFALTREHTREFTYLVPEALPTNAQLDVFGIALGPSTQTRLSVPRSVVVAQCEPSRPGCG
jgi:hypothetical protein